MTYLSGLFVTTVAAFVAVWFNDTFKIGAELPENTEGSEVEGNHSFH